MTLEKFVENTVLIPEKVAELDQIFISAVQSRFSLYWKARKQVFPLNTVNHGDTHDARNIVVPDLFSTTPRNLRFNVMREAPISMADPSGLISGWVAYHFRWFAGFPTKAEE